MFKMEVDETMKVDSKAKYESLTSLQGHEKAISSLRFSDYHHILASGCKYSSPFYDIVIT